MKFASMLQKDNKNTKSGLNHWWHQKISAFLLLPITIWFITVLPSFMALDYANKVIWINVFPNYLLLSIFFTVSSYHIKLGLTVVIEDYIHNNRIKKIFILILLVITLLMIIIALLLSLLNIIGVI